MFKGSPGTVFVGLIEPTSRKGEVRSGFQRERNVLQKGREDRPLCKRCRFILRCAVSCPLSGRSSIGVPEQLASVIAEIRTLYRAPEEILDRY